MPHAHVWDLPDWTPPLTVGELATKPGIGYFTVSTPTAAIVTDVTGALYVRKTTSLRPIPGPTQSGWVIQAGATGDGVALHIPKPVYGYITRDDQAKNKTTYMPVAKVLQHQLLHHPAPDNRVGPHPVGADAGYKAFASVGAGTGVVPLVRRGSEVGSAQVTWGDGAVTVEFLDAYGVAGIANARAVRGFTLKVTSNGTSVAVLEA